MFSYRSYQLCFRGSISSSFFFIFLQFFNCSISNLGGDGTLVSENKKDDTLTIFALKPISTVTSVLCRVACIT